MDRFSAETNARRASSFGGNAAAYAAERPDYPEAAIRWALEPVADRGALRVLDLAAGTGKLTIGLRRLGVDVVAVEPDEAMLAELHRLLPDVPAMTGSAERIPLDDGSVDAILVGQALHWFDLDRAFPEMVRVLTPGGVLAGMWNLDDDRVPWVRTLGEMWDSTVSVGTWDDHEKPEPSAYFPVLEHENFPHSQRRTAESMVATVGTHSHVLIMSDEERADLLGRIGDFLRLTPETADGEFDLPIVTVAIRGVRAA